MTITRQFLEEHAARLTQQIAAFSGALEFAEMLLKKLDEPVHATDHEATRNEQEEYQETHQTALR